MKNMSKWIGIMSIAEGIIYLIGMISFAGLLHWGSADTALKQIGIMSENQNTVFATIFFIYIVFGVLLVALTLGLNKTLNDYSFFPLQVFNAIGMIWATAVIAAGMVFLYGMKTTLTIQNTEPTEAKLLWTSVTVIFEALGGGNEFLGGLWSMLISVIGFKTRVFSSILNTLGILIGFAGLTSIIPVFGEASTAIFGLGQLIWFFALGITLIKLK